ncbi:family A G protein-coupled receptor-like protein [Trametes coccinea BRFM310]|uniref:Family A G protein-coupled receptor-like protein n=1 Tax=Trametes coccinea (strain BRFM310) TaxID=1353009 RepID=A0A1Y2IB25_TRAC3|nr:family A G protein-coupled receptor-like protein [Trametes coccinea BRFM310]
MGNDALNSNPPNATYNLSTHGSDWLWAVFSLFGLSLLIVAAWTFTRPRGTRLFHQVAIVVLTTGALSYFSMASDLGATPIPVEFRGDGTRQIWYVRYIQWFISFPLLLLMLLLATGVTLSDIFTTIFMALVLVVTGLIAALVPSTYKWGYYTFGLLALFYIWSVLLHQGPRTTFAAGPTFKPGYSMGAGYLSFLLLLYPIAWALTEGANVITVTSEMIWFGILDILAGPLFLFYFLWRLRTVDYAAFGLQSGKYTYAGVGTEKRAMAGTGAGPGTMGATNGAATTAGPGAVGGVAATNGSAATNGVGPTDPVAPTVAASPSGGV